MLITQRAIKKGEIISDRCLEKLHLLSDHADSPPHLWQRRCAYINSIEENRALIGIIKTHQQTRDTTFAMTSSPHYTQYFSRCQRKREIAQNRMPARISKCDILKRDFQRTSR